MQLKDLLLSSFCILSCTVLHAQKHEGFTMPQKQMRVVKTDTIVLRKAIVKSDKPTIAANLPVAPAKKVYKPVPLAGEQHYYGNMNDYMSEYVRKYLSSHNKTLNVVQNRSNTPFPLIDNILQQHDIPKELKYLAVIESALNNNAVSRVGAVGPWQFMSSTAKLMGLTVNGRRDDRKDWYKSTTAAAKYLTYLYSQLNDWLLVVAAYNSGPTPVQRAIQRTGSTNFWDIKQHLPRETQGHVLAFIATATIFENLSKFIGIADLPENLAMCPEAAAQAAEKKPAKPRYTDEELKNMAIVRISEPLSMDLMVQELGVEKKLLEKWNPDYELFVYDTYGAEFYSLRLPKDKLDNFIAKKDLMTKRSKQIFSAMNM